MAFDGYRSPPPGRPADQPPYLYDHPDARPPWPPAAAAGHPAAYPPEHPNGRPRGPSAIRPEGFPPFDANRYAPAKPINEAVTSAFHRADDSGYSYPPELVSQISAQITEDVISRLRATRLDSGGGGDSSATPSMARSHSNSGSHPPSNSTSPPLPTGSVHNPPSPRQKPEFPRYNSPPAQTGPAHPPSSLPRSPREQPAPRPTERRQGSPDVTQSPSRTRRPTDVNRSPSRTRKPQPPPPAADVEETAFDRRWGPLFEDGRATARLGQFFRGLARHIIKDFEPKNSLVVTPAKMAKYYELVKLEYETYPWNALFKTSSSPRLSRVYQDLECQHHLTQDRSLGEYPTIPGLTPIGFSRWMTLIMLSDPDSEVERLQKTVLEMPISNADDHSERFPKEVSRHLFPMDEDWKMRSKLDKAFASEDIKQETSRSSIKTEPSRSIPKADSSRSDSGLSAAVPPLSGSFSNLERERKPYSATPSESAIDDLPGPPPGPPPGGPPPPSKIERERQPYSAQPGAGRLYENEKKSGNPAHLERANSASKVRPQHAYPRPAGGGIGIGMPGMPGVPGGPADVPLASSVPPEMPSSGHHRAASTSINNGPRLHHRRSPSLSSHGPAGEFRRSDNDILGHREPTAPINMFEDDGPGLGPGPGPGPGSMPGLGPAGGPRRYAPPRRAPDDGYESSRDRERFDRAPEVGPPPRRGYEEEYYRPPPMDGMKGVQPGTGFHPPPPPPPGAGLPGPGYEYNQHPPYPPPAGYR